MALTKADAGARRLRAGMARAAVAAASRFLARLGRRPPVARQPAPACSCSCARQSALLADLTHEMREPVNTILGFAETLAGAAASNLGDAQRRNCLDTLIETSRGLSALLSDVADLARCERGLLRLGEQEVDAAELAETAVKLCQEAVEKADVTLLVDVVEDLEIVCDGLRLGRVLVGLVSRAVRVSLPGTVVRMSLRATAGGDLEYAIADTGPALSPEAIEALFEPDLRAQGTESLTLPIARQIAMLHGGAVSIEGVAGAGMVVRLVLPAGRVRRPSEQAGRTARAA